MKSLLFIILIISQIAYGQIDELRKAQDTRKEYLSRITSTDYFSKTPFVNPFIGTGGHGHTYPGASAPFGMVQLSPDTRYEGWDGCSGYHYSDSVIYGFSHTHLSGTGVPDYCDLLIMPQSGKPNVDPGYLKKGGYGSTFSHANENASPGYYDVHLDRGDIDVRLTVTERAGLHEYTFNDPNGKKFILIDMDHRDKLLASCMQIIDDHTIEGKRESQAWATDQYFYFHLETDVDFQKSRLITSNGRHKILLIFPKETKKVMVKVGISAVDQMGAEKNLKTEIKDWNFNSVRAEVTRKWNQELDKIEFFSDDADVMTNFYTALYHSFLNPNLFNDVDGRFRNLSNKIDTLNPNDGRNYTVFSLWDTYRATHPLFTITQRQRTNEFIRTFLRQYDERGELPVWELAANETYCMIGYHSVSVISDAFMKGIREYDALSAVRAMTETSNLDNFGKPYYIENGFMSTGEEPESVSKTLEYAYDDFCIYQMVKGLKNVDIPLSTEDVKNDYFKRSFNFINVFDPQTGFMRARRSGLWFSPFDPSEVNFNYTEANSWQYSLYAPHAVGVLSDLLGSKDLMENWLDRLFTTKSELSGRHQVDITGLIGQYAHGNEPSHHMAYLYNYTNHPEKTQYYVDKILKEMYTPYPDGLSGNEDCGQMSSWYVLSSLGIYQIAPGNPYYDLGRPILNNAKIHLENGKTFEIKVKNQSKENIYIQKVILNGQQLDRSYISHKEITNGGSLVFEMGSTPSPTFNKSSHAPTLEEIPDDFVPAPFFTNENRIFDTNAEIEISAIPLSGTEIHYTTDGSTPDLNSPVYTGSISINETTTVKAVVIKGNDVRSCVIENEFIKKDHSVSIELESEYANQYAAYGDLTLIDGIRGNNEFRTGDWQGYWAQDIIANISISEPKKLNEVGISVLRDMKSWIFYPSEVTVEVEYKNGDKETFRKKLGDATKDEQFPDHQEIVFEVSPDIAIRAIRIVAKNYGKCPDWHLGAGNDTWLFADEIIMR